MLKRGEHKISGTATLGKLSDARKIHREPGPVASRLKVVEAGSSVLQTARGLADIQSLVELVVENRGLRSAAIKLAQEIRHLQARR
jgi:hypothetical protein